MHRFEQTKFHLFKDCFLNPRFPISEEIPIFTFVTRTKNNNQLFQEPLLLSQLYEKSINSNMQMKFYCTFFNFLEELDFEMIDPNVRTSFCLNDNRSVSEFLYGNPIFRVDRVALQNIEVEARRGVEGVQQLLGAEVRRVSGR